jgi:hypothetical protein
MQRINCRRKTPYMEKKKKRKKKEVNQSKPTKKERFVKNS